MQQSKLIVEYNYINTIKLLHLHSHSLSYTVNITLLRVSHLLNEHTR